MSADQAEDQPAKSPEAEQESAEVAPASPGGFRLDREPPQVMRLSRRTLAIAGAFAGVAIGGALLFALRPETPEPPENLYRAETPNRADVVTGAPVDYSDVPESEPPLPGALDQPIVSAQLDGAEISVPSADPVPEHEAARSSRIFSGINGSSGAREAGGEAAIPTASESASSGMASDPALQRFPSSFSGRRSFESDERIWTASSPNVLQAGSVIPAALITAIHSDLPGQVTAQVTRNVYDSPTGRILLIPQGARLLGEYDSDIAVGQDRVFLIWTRLILPDGQSIGLDRQPGADAAGMAGLSDQTDFHWDRMLRAALVSSILGVGAELGTSSDDRLARALRDGAQDTFNQSGQQLVERELRVSPTLTIRPGFPLRVIVTRDLIIEASRGGDDR